MQKGFPVREGMPWWKYIGNRLLTKLENAQFGLNLSEYHTGYRAYSREVLESVNFMANSDDFIFDQEIIAQIVEAKFRIAEISVPVRYFPAASSASLLASVIYGLKILLLLLRFWIHKRTPWKALRFCSLRERYRLAGRDMPKGTA